MKMIILSLYTWILKNIKCTYFFVGLLRFSNIFLVVGPFLLIKVYLDTKKRECSARHMKGKEEVGWKQVSTPPTGQLPSWGPAGNPCSNPRGRKREGEADRKVMTFKNVRSLGKEKTALHKLTRYLLQDWLQWFLLVVTSSLPRIKPVSDLSISTSFPSAEVNPYFINRGKVRTAFNFL